MSSAADLSRNNWKNKLGLLTIRDYIPLLVLILYFVWNLILLILHEPWRDEANAWLFARDCSLFRLFSEIHFQGHPCLWYLILMPFAKIGFPIFTMGIISLLFMTAAAWLLIFRVTLPLWCKVLLLFSPVYTYYYPVVSRNYCLIPFLLLLFVSVYSERDRHPLLVGLIPALLIQADTIALPLAGILCLMWLWQGLQAKKYLLTLEGLCLPLLSLFLWISEFITVSESPEFGIHIDSASDFIVRFRNFSMYIIERLTGAGGGYALILLAVLGVLMILLCICARSIWPLLLFFGSLFFEAAFSVLFYQMHVWHFITVIHAAILAYAISYHLTHFPEESPGDSGQKSLFRLTRLCSGIVLSFLALLMICRWNSEGESSSLQNALFGTYSDSKQAAGYFREHADSSDVILTCNIELASSIVASLPERYRFVYAGTLLPSSYSNYTEEEHILTDWNTLCEGLNTDYPEQNAFYLLYCNDNCITDLDQVILDALYSEGSVSGSEDSVASAADNAPCSYSWELLYETPVPTAQDENYVIYRITRN